MEPATYLSQGKFHRSVWCSKTQSRVTFALVGDWGDAHHLYSSRPSVPTEVADNAKNRLILYVLPSGCSRYIGILLDGIACSRGVRIVAIDRPGAGGTSKCPGVDRLSVSTDQTISVLHFLGYGHGEDGPQQAPISIMTHSFGWFYVMDLVTKRPDLFFRDLDSKQEMRMLFSSAFVPTHLSGATLLSLLPRGVFSLAPTAHRMLSVLNSTVSWSAGLSENLRIRFPVTSSNKEQIRQKSLARFPTARFHPPYESHSSLALNVGTAAAKPRDSTTLAVHPGTGRRLPSGEVLLSEYFALEGGVEAAVEDLLFALGKVQARSNKELEEWMSAKVQELCEIVSKSKNDLQLVLLWGEKDGLIPVKGRQYLSSHLTKAGLVTDEWLMAGGGHDDPVASRQVMTEAFAFLTDRA